MRRNWWKWAIGGVVALIVVIVGGSWFYIKVIEGDPPKPLSFEDLESTTTAAAAPDPTSAVTTAGSAAATTAPATSAAAGSQTGIDGAWKAAESSQVGYRVKETLFGQSTEAVGRTNDVTGSLTITGSTVGAGDFTVDMTTVKSDSSQRDNQFNGRIMNTSQFPTSTFKLTQPIELGSVPADGLEVSATATGDLTLKGTTKTVTFPVTARLSNGQVQVTGSIPITFADYGISNPSFGPASVGDDGTLEFLLVFER